MTTLPDGWDAAVQYHRLKRVLPFPLRKEVEDRAVREILKRARAMLRHTTRPTQRVDDHFPADGDLDLDATLEHRPAGHRHSLAVQRTEQRNADVIAVLDMSLSMTGDKIALIALATAILGISLERIGVVHFDTKAHKLVDLRESINPEELVRRVMTVPAQGYTNITSGLRMTARTLSRSRLRERCAVLMTDGVANVGGNPVPAAGTIPKLHVVQVGADEPRGAKACRAMANAGHGRHYSAPSYADLPRIVQQLVRECFRG